MKFSEQSSGFHSKKKVEIKTHFFSWPEKKPNLAIFSSSLNRSNWVCRSTQTYAEAEEIILRVYGFLHPALDRLYLNVAIAHEETGDYYRAFDYFRRWFDNCRELYGLEHNKTRRPISTLNEPVYRRIATERGVDVPTPLDVDNTAWEVLRMQYGDRFPMVRGAISHIFRSRGLIKNLGLRVLKRFMYDTKNVIRRVHRTVFIYA